MTSLNQFPLERANLPAMQPQAAAESELIARVNLCWPTSVPVRESKAKPGDYYVQPTGINLGSQFNCLLLHDRWTAIELDNVTLLQRISGPVEVKESDAYQKLVNSTGIGFLHGRELLLYLFTYNIFCTYLLGRKTDRDTGYQRFGVPTPKQEQERDQALDKVRAEGGKDLIPNLMQAYNGPLTRGGVRFTVNETPGFYRDKDSGKRMPCTYYKPIPTFLPPEYWQVEYAEPNMEEIEKQIITFAKPVTLTSNVETTTQEPERPR